LRERFGEDASNVRRIFNGLDLERFPYHSPRERQPLILATGRLVEKKGFGVLIEACALLARRGRHFQCEIIGDGALRPQLQAQIEELQIGGHVRLAGARPQHEVIERICHAAAMATPCVIGDDGNRDGLPTVLLEAMALGTPCVSTDVTGIPEVVRDMETGLMVGQHDPDGLSRALEQLLDHEDLRIDLASRARQLIEGEFDINENTRLLREIFTQPARTSRVQEAVVEPRCAS
ncbi:MAG: glycosyltransferase, partial [Planctomycetota bacterium]